MLFDSIKENIIPEFSCYYPTESIMNKEQLSFYKYLEKELFKGNHIDVNGNISYLFTFVYKILSNWGKEDYRNLGEYLTYLSEIYLENKKFSDYCIFWANDCFLGLGQYDKFLEITEPKNILKTQTHYSNLRLNIQRHIGERANPLDLVLLGSSRNTKFLKNNHGLYKEKIRQIFTEYEDKNKNWFETTLLSNSYKYSLFSGAIINKLIYLNELDLHPYYSSNKILNLIKELSKEAENLARKEMGLPLIGEGWISETELFRKIEKKFKETTVIQHGQPSWLGRQHFDIWIPSWKIAVEYHGEQHFKPIDFFGGNEAFIKNQERDKRKINLAKRHGVKLFIVSEGYNEDDLLNNIEKQRNKVVLLSSKH